MASSFSHFINKIHGRTRGARSWLKHKILVALVWALVFSFFPWSPSPVMPAVEQAFENAPQVARWAKPLALSITNWTDEALSAMMGPVSVNAGTNVTLTLSKRDDGPSVEPVRVGPDPVAVGTILVYYVEITNTGKTTATVFFTETLPTELECVDADATHQTGGADWFGGCLPDRTGLFIRTQDSLGLGKGLGAGQRAILYIQTQVRTGLSDGHIITNLATNYRAIAKNDPPYVYTGRNDVRTTVQASQSAVDHFVILPIADHQAGENFAITIAAVDQFNQTVTGFNGTVGIRDNTSPNTLQPSTVSFSGGVVNGKNISITLARASTSIVVGTGSMASTSNPFTIRVAAPDKVTVSASQVNIPVGTNEPVTATVVDKYSNPVGTGTVAFSTSRGTISPASVSLNSAGQARSFASSTSTGPATIVATAAGSIVGSTVITFVAGCPNTLSVLVEPDRLQVGNPAVVTVNVKDRYGNKVDWASVTFAAGGLGAGQIAPTTAALDSNGTATATLVSTLIGQKTVTVNTVAERGCSPISGQDTATFTSGAAAKLAVSMSPDPQQVSVDADLTALVTDQFGNPVASQVVRFTADEAGLGGGGLSAATDTSNASGEATVQISSTLIGGVEVRATLQSNQTIFDTDVVSFTSGPPRYLVVTVSPTEVENDVPATLVVTMTDRYGNPCAWQDVNFSTDPAYPGTPTITPNPARANAAGVASALISGPVIGTIKVTARGNSSYTGMATLHVVAGPLEDFQTNVLADVEAGVNFTLHITAVDALGQHREEDGAILLTDATGTLQPSTVSMSDGYATAVLSITQATDNDWIRLIWQSDPAILTTTNRFAVTPGAPATMTLQYEPEMASCADQPITTTVIDRFTNLVPGEIIQFSATPATVNLIPSGSLTTDANGQAVLYVRSTQLGVASVNAQVTGGIKATALITFGIGAPEVVTLTTSSMVIQAGGRIALTTTVEDCGGRRLADLGLASAYVPHLSTGAGIVSPTSGTTNGLGQYTFVFTGTKTGSAYLVVSYMVDEQIYTKEIIVTVIPGPPVTVILIADPPAIVPEGRHSMLNAVVRDAYGNTVPGCEIAFEQVSGPSVLFDPITRTATSDINGTASITLTSTAEEGVAQIRAFAPLLDFSDTFSVTIRWFRAYLPFVAKRYPTGDLEVIQITSRMYTEPDQTRPLYEVRVTIRNNGPQTVSGFWVDLYLDPRLPITTNVLWHQVSRMGKAWYVDKPLAPGATLLLSTNDPDRAPAGIPQRVYSYWPGYLVGTAPHQLWAMVDSWGTMPFGIFDEPDEKNNILGPVQIP